MESKVTNMMTNVNERLIDVDAIRDILVDVLGFNKEALSTKTSVLAVFTDEPEIVMQELAKRWEMTPEEFIAYAIQTNRPIFHPAWAAAVEVMGKNDRRYYKLADSRGFYEMYWQDGAVYFGTLFDTTIFVDGVSADAADQFSGVIDALMDDESILKPTHNRAAYILGPVLKDYEMLGKDKTAIAAEMFRVLEKSAIRPEEIVDILEYAQKWS